MLQVLYNYYFLTYQWVLSDFSIDNHSNRIAMVWQHFTFRMTAYSDLNGQCSTRSSRSRLERQQVPTNTWISDLTMRALKGEVHACSFSLLTSFGAKACIILIITSNSEPLEDVYVNFVYDLSHRVSSSPLTSCNLLILQSCMAFCTGLSVCSLLTLLLWKARQHDNTLVQEAWQSASTFKQKVCCELIIDNRKCMVVDNR